MISAELKRAAIYHLISGTILSMTILLAIVLNKYEKSLLDTIGRFEHIQMNTIKLHQFSADADLIMRRINDMLPADYASRTHREILLLALDDIKMAFSGSSIIVTNFEEKAGELSLPVSIKFPVNDYTLLVNKIGYLQSLKFPYFTVKSLTIEKATDKEAIISTIEGALKMPVERIRIKR